MNTLFILFTIVLVSVMVSSSPIDFEQVDMFPERHAQRNSWPVKGGWHEPGAKDQATLSPLAYKVRKGEYVCGNKICKLKPGEIPKGCNGICQYPL